MTDHRVTDLSYGHPGKASYDIEERKWNFSQAFDQQISIQQLLPLKEYIPPSTQEASEESEPPSVVRQHQVKFVLRAQPVVYPAETVLTTISKVSSSEKYDQRIHTGALFAVGRAIDTNRVAGSSRLSSRRPRIFAFSYGVAGHILQLALPRREIRAWGKTSGARLSMLDAFSLEKGFWVGTGGTIYQVAFSDDETGSGTWLAVRQAAVITIFRPLYGKLHSSQLGKSSSETFPPSLLNPNPVVTVTGKGNVGIHADVSFNPWYSRQFAIVDSHGHWEIYSLERSHARDGLERTATSNHGEMYGDEDSEQSLKKPAAGHLDGWYRILWVCNVNTIIVCNRRHLVLFDIEGKVTSIDASEFIATSSSDWILDIVISLTDKNQILVLTTSRIYWVQINPGGANDKSDFFGIKILLSYLHFRDPSDQTMKLTLVKDNYFSAIVTSSTSPIINIYHFWTSTEGLGIPCARQSSLIIYSEIGEQCCGRTTCLTPCPLISVPLLHRASGPEVQYLEQEIKFYQLWILNQDLSLSTTLCAIKILEHEKALGSLLRIKAPDTRILKPSHHSERRVFDVPFIVPNGVGEEEPFLYSRSRGRIVDKEDLSNPHVQTLRLRLNWGAIFQVISQTSRQTQNLRHDELPGISEILIYISERLRQGIDEDFFAFRTIGEISGTSEMKGELDRAAPVLQDFLGSLIRNQDTDKPSILILSNLTTCLSLDIPLHETSKYPDLLKIYDHLVEQWMGYLPRNVSSRTRGAKFKIIRQLALDLCFSSIGLSLQNQMASASLRIIENDDTTTQETSPSVFSSQLASVPEQETDFNLPTPAHTPSLYSQATSGSELREGATINRLRQYVPSIKAKTDFEQPALLSHWPSLPGVNPSLYSYESALKTSSNFESGDEANQRGRREEARRRRRTEKFLRMERSRAVETASQAAATPSGSQPAASREPFSSQVVNDLPMTQPDRGTFGSRSVHRAQKGKKKRTAGFR